MAIVFEIIHTPQIKFDYNSSTTCNYLQNLAYYKAIGMEHPVRTKITNNDLFATNSGPKKKKNFGLIHKKKTD